MVIFENKSLITEAPFFSIITVVRNGSNTLQRCINSVASQTFKDFEYIVIDGASVDSTIEIIHKNSKSINLAISEADEGLYFAMNKGLKLAMGQYIGILNSDDTYFPNTLKLVRDAINCNDGAKVIYGAMNYLSRPNDIQFIHSNELPKRMIFHPTCFVSKDTYLRCGNFDTRYRVAADYEFILRCKQAGEKFYGLNEVLASFSDGGTSAKQRLRSILETSEIQALYNFESKPLKYLKLIRILLATYLREVLKKICCSIEKTMRR